MTSTELQVDTEVMGWHRLIPRKLLRAFAVAVLAALALIRAPCGWTETPGPLAPAPDQQLASDILKELVEINTTHEFGSLEAAEAIQHRLLAGGFVASDVVVVAPPGHPAKANVVARYRGKGLGKPVLFIGHLDVVDARPQDWRFDPFKLTENDGWYYGRGSIDMKDGDAALTESLIRLKREGYVPDRDVIAAFTADEEAGGDANGVAFLLKDRRDLIDAGLVVNLDGGGGNLKNGGRYYYEIGTSEKTYVTYTLETRSPGGHGSLPGPDNAIYRLADGLARLEGYKFPVIITTTTRVSFKSFAALEPGPQSADMLAVAKSPPDLHAAERLSKVIRLNAQLRTTCVATLVSGGHAENALPERARATIQCRMMPGDTEQHVRTALIATLHDSRISVTLDAAPIVSPESLPTPPIMDKVSRVVHSMWPGVPIIPTMDTGYSDDRQTRNAGLPSYDLAGVWMDVDENRAHGTDERIGIRAFDESVEYTYRLVQEMGSSD